MTLVREALAVAQESLPAYSSKFSRHDYTQHQHFALLALREFLKTDYRGLEALLLDWAELRETLGLSKVPDHSTLQKAAERLQTNNETLPSWRKPSSKKGCTATACESSEPAASPGGWTQEEFRI